MNEEKLKKANQLFAKKMALKRMDEFFEDIQIDIYIKDIDNMLYESKYDQINDVEYALDEVYIKSLKDEILDMIRRRIDIGLEQVSQEFENL